MRSQRGWTLKEFLIVIGVIMLLAALVYPIIQIARYRSYETKCRANLWNIMLKYQAFKDEGYKGQELRRQTMFYAQEHPEVGKCPLTGEEYVILTILGSHEMGDELWMDNPEVVVACPCHLDPKRKYKMEGCTRVAAPGEPYDTWQLSGVDRGSHVSVEYAPDMVRIQR